jgi:hypothetical protein
MQRASRLAAVLSIAIPLSLVAGARPARAGDDPAVEAALPTTAELIRRGDRQARAGKRAEALEDWKRAFMRRFPTYRDHAFKWPVEAEYLGRDSLRAKLVEEFRKEMPDEKIAAEGKALIALGLLKPKVDLKETMLGLLTEEVAGFYDPDSKSLHMIREAETKKKSWIEKLAGSGPNIDEEKTALVHELCHALADQGHDLQSMQKSAEDDDDMVLAIQALIEGEATLCMLVAEDRSGSRDILRSPPAVMAATLDLTTPFLTFMGGPSLKKAPRFLKESLLFPYFKGLIFCLSLTSPVGDWKPVDAAFDRPPLSTEQVLHPERYPVDVPLAVSFPDVAGDLGPGWSPVYANSLGEFGIRLLLSEKLGGAESDRAAAGWGGDFYRVYERKADGPEGAPALAVAWATLWDTEADAGEFRAAAENLIEKRKGREGSLSRATASGKSVVVLLDVPEAAAGPVRERASRIESEPKVYRPKKVKPAVEFSGKKPLPERRV